jgi:excisionase family DNA binding protein
MVGNLATSRPRGGEFGMASGELHRDTFAGAINSTKRADNCDVDLEQLLTVAEVAALLKVSRSWVYEHTRSRGTPRSERLPHIKVGKYVRFEARALREFIQKKCRPM